MSERKRWADDQIKALWDSERLGGPTAEPGTLEADHLQAREDVKRLRTRVLERMEQHCPDERRCVRCQADAALLAETGS